MLRKTCVHRFGATLVLVLLVGATSQAQSSSFTYQGRLTDGGAAANGSYDFQFTLFDSLSGGAQIGSTQTLNSVAVSNGTFTVSLDFGASSFPGANRFLEISARSSGAGSFTLLTPRQQVTSSPYSVRSVSAANADTATNATSASTATNALQLGGVTASQYVQTSDTRLSDPRPPTPGSSNYIQTNSSSAQSANFNISGNGTVGGTLTGNIVNVSTQYELGGFSILSAPGNAGGGNLFAGRGTGNSTLTGDSNNSFGNFAGQQITSGTQNSFFGQAAGNHTSSGSFNSFFGTVSGDFNTTGSGNSFFGSHTGMSGANPVGSNNTLLGSSASANSGVDNGTAIGANAQVTQSNSLVLGSIANPGLGTADTNVGIGTTAPVSRFHVKGTSWFQGDTTPLPSTAGLGLAIGTGTNSNNSYGYIFAFNYATASVHDLLLNYPGGKVGIGTFNPDQTLTVNGNASKVGGGSWASFSDERLKNIKGRFTPGLKAVMQLQPLRYEYKPDNALNLKSEGEHVGFSAQAVRKIIPEAVSQNDKGYLLINNDPILWTMLNAIKEQQSQISQQQGQLKRQQEQIKRQEDQARQQRAAFAAQQQELDALKHLVCRSNRRASVCR